jgi:hypothetical protein
MRTTNVTSVLQAKRTGKAVLGVPLMHMGESKVECTLVQSLRLCTGRTAHRGSRALALLFLNHGTRRGEGSASRPGRSLPPRKTRYPLYMRLGTHGGSEGIIPLFLNFNTRWRSVVSLMPCPGQPTPCSVQTDLSARPDRKAMKVKSSNVSIKTLAYRRHHGGSFGL